MKTQRSKGPRSDAQNQVEKEASSQRGSSLYRVFGPQLPDSLWRAETRGPTGWFSAGVGNGPWAFETRVSKPAALADSNSRSNQRRTLRRRLLGGRGSVGCSRAAAAHQRVEWPKPIVQQPHEKRGAQRKPKVITKLEEEARQKRFFCMSFQNKPSHLTHCLRKKEWRGRGGRGRWTIDMEFVRRDLELGGTEKGVLMLLHLYVVPSS